MSLIIILDTKQARPRDRPPHASSSLRRKWLHGTELYIHGSKSVRKDMQITGHILITEKTTIENRRSTAKKQTVEKGAEWPSMNSIKSHVKTEAQICSLLKTGKPEEYMNGLMTAKDLKQRCINS